MEAIVCCQPSGRGGGGDGDGRLTGGVAHGLDVEDDDGDALFLEQPDNGTTNAARAAGDDDNLLGPVIAVVDPVVADAVREPAANGSGEGDVEELGQTTVGDGMQDGQVLALLGVAGEQQQREEEARVEGGGADDLEDDVKAEALAGEEAGMDGHCVCVNPRRLSVLEK